MDYEFNKHGVCINPDIIHIEDYTRVEVARCGKDAWVHGLKTLTGGSPCMRDVDVAPTKEDAIREGLKRLIRWLSKDAEWYERAGEHYTADLRRTRTVKKLAEDELRKRIFVQQTLF